MLIYDISPDTLAQSDGSANIDIQRGIAAKFFHHGNKLP